MITEIDKTRLISIEIAEQHPLDSEIEDDYWDHLRMGLITQNSWQILRNLLRPFYQLREDDPSQTKAAIFQEGIISQVAEGERSGIVLPDNPRDWQTLSHTVLNTSGTHQLGAIICPDYAWHKEGDTVVYDMGKLNDGLPKTAESLYKYLETMSERAERFSQPVSFTGYFPAWELNRPNQPELNGGISISESRRLLDNSARVTNEHLSSLNNEYFNSQIKMLDPENFHPRVSLEADQILTKNHKRAAAVLNARQGFYGEQTSLEDVARDLAEAKLGFELISHNSDIIIVPTSPTIARFCLSGSDQAWIQLAHGYKG